MKEVPNIISTKDLAYIEDMLNWNYNLIKKLNLYKNLVTNKEIQKIFETAIKEHKKSYEKLLTILE